MADDAQKTAGQKLDEYMVRTCRNKSAVARKAGIPVKTLNEMLMGRQKINTAQLKAICMAMEAPASSFLDD